MTLSIPPERRYTVEEYLALESSSTDAKFEYREGHIVDMRQALAMSGGSLDHVIINTNVVALLSNQLKHGPCHVYGSDLRVRIPRKTLYTFPDATIICGKVETEKHPTAGETATNPTAIVEILSPSTELYDRTRKFSLYGGIPTLREYILVSQSEPKIEAFYRHEDGGWAFNPFEGLESVAKLRSVPVELALSQVYEQITFPSE